MLADLRPLGDLLPENIADTDLRECEARRARASKVSECQTQGKQESGRGKCTRLTSGYVSITICESVPLPEP